MKILIHSRQSVERMLPLLDELHIFISISNPGGAEVRLPSNGKTTLGILRLAFHDLDRVPGPAFIETYGTPVLFSEEDADRIATFAIKFIAVQTVVINCEAGQSRSAGVGAALALYFNGDDSEFFTQPLYGEPRYTPNMRVYRMTLEALNQKEPMK